MNGTPNVYDRARIERLQRFDGENLRALAAVMGILGVPGSFLDVGCGSAALLDWVAKWTSKVKGVDLVAADYRVVAHDLREPLDLERNPYELVICWEVGEYLPEESANQLCETLARYTKTWLVFTAAHPGQGGDGHLNEQPQGYWREKLETQGLLYNQEYTERVKLAWQFATGPMWWLPANVQVFEGKA